MLELREEVWTLTSKAPPRERLFGARLDVKHPPRSMQARFEEIIRVLGGFHRQRRHEILLGNKDLGMRAAIITATLELIIGQT